MSPFTMVHIEFFRFSSSKRHSFSRDISLPPTAYEGRLHSWLQINPDSATFDGAMC